MSKEVPFEKAFERLEAILEEMNGGKVSLDGSIKLYSEADKLIASCQKRLNDAEQTIELLIKGREGTLSLDDSNQPLAEAF